MRKRACMAIIGIMMLIPATTYVQEVFTSGGGYYIHGSFSFSTTLGEPITETFTLPGKFFTQGMQQPHTRACVNPLDGGRIGNPQVSCGDFNPDPVSNVELPRHYFGALEYLWVYSTLGETGPFDTLTLAGDTVYDPPLLTQTTWFKRLSRARCMPDWSKAAESNVVMITVHPLPTVALNLVQDELCEGSAGLLLAGGTPAGGTYTGTYIINGSFYAAFSGPGSFPVTYTYKDLLGCEAQAVHNITVLPLPVVSHPALSVCVDAPTLVLSGGNPAGGSYSGGNVSNGIFQVATAGVGTHTINYAYKGANGCTRIVPLTVSVHPLPVVTHAPLPYVCENHGLVSLGGGEPTGGTYSGSHVSGGSFDPAAAGPGLHSITYTYRDATTQCVQTINLNIEVKPLPQVSISADTAICLGACATLRASGGHSYLWSTGSTTPVVTLCPATSRNFHITISNSEGCAVVKTISVDVLPLPPAAVATDTICQGGVASLMASGGVSYAWDNGLTSPSIQVSPLQTSQYSVTVTAANGWQGHGHGHGDREPPAACRCRG